jgi:hypothetical protein
VLPFSQWPSKWAARTQSVTEDQFCAKRTAEGFPRNLCSQQYAIWRARVSGKESAYASGVQGQFSG